MMSTPAAALVRALSTPISRQVAAAVRPTVGVFCRAQRGYVTASSAKGGDNKLSSSSKVPSTVEKKPAQETMTQIKSTLVSLVSEEIGARKEGGDETSSMWEVSQKWAQETGFTVTENAEGITTMTKKAGPHTVTITFDPNEQGENENEADENENEEDEEETDENGERQMIESGESNKELHFEVKVTFGERGSLNLYAFTPEDGRLYVDHLSVSDGLAEDAKVREFDWYNLGDDTQDKLYDFFDKLGVDDQLAKYIKLSAVQAESNREVEFLNTFKSLLLSK